MSGACANDADIYVPQIATVLKAEPLTATEMFLEFKLDSGEELGQMPGQFAQVSVAGFGEAPLSISSSPTLSGSFQMGVRKAGRVTAALHRLAEGDRVGIRGPFGTHFPVEDTMKGKDVLVVAGGIGLVPVRSVIQYVLHNRDDYGNVTILFGARSPAERLFTDELAQWNARDDVTFMETVDAGDENWTGNVGVITTLLPKIQIDPQNTVAVICGPPIMYKFVILALQDMKVSYDDIYLSLERRMKCGVGKCGHCQINGLYVCQDGPVFRYADVADTREAIQ